jgi:ribose transport system ATP-binding protein
MTLRPGDTSQQLILETRGLSKVFGNGTQALTEVDLQVRPATIHGIVGANGAGKSTLIKIISGAIRPSEGAVIWKGSEVDWSSPRDARAAGVRTIYQHIPLVPTLSVLDNVFLDQAGFLRGEGGLHAAFRQLLERIDYDIDPEALVVDLPIGDRQMVAILQALSQGAELVIMDEPTASLSDTERELAFSIARRLRAQGTTFLYISHFLDEILDLTEEVTVLRDGRVTLRETTATLDAAKLVTAIAGRRLVETEHHRVAADTLGEPLLEVEHLSVPGRIADVSLTVRAGEVVGLAGLLGSGRSELLHAIFGADSRSKGSVKVAGQKVGRSTGAAVDAGVALVPEDRFKQGLLGPWSIWQNTSLPDVKRLSWRGLVPSEAQERARADRVVAALGVVTRTIDTEVRDLSGGNAQKVVFGKWLDGTARVVLLDDPTVGVDVAAKSDILELIRGFARQGKAVLMASSDFEELVAVSDRILILADGVITAELDAATTTDTEVLGLASGLGLGATGAGATATPTDPSPSPRDDATTAATGMPR